MSSQFIAQQKELLLAQTKDRMGKLFTSNQILGRIQTIGCVAVEITQRCNLDCTLCYLSEHSQAVRDIPISEIFKRLDNVITHYGKGTHVQITGGDPTLRKHRELIEIVRYARDIGLYPALFTNGLAASRELLTQLASVGLCDVAFHVDTTQRRKGYKNEVELNEIRQEYINRARGLGLTVIFNTTVHKENFAEIPALVNFFSTQADTVGLISFQLQADTGRGEWKTRDIIINKETVQQQIEVATKKTLPWDAMQLGHSDCHSYLPNFVVNNNIHPMMTDKHFFSDFVKDFSTISWDRHTSTSSIVASFLQKAITKPLWWPRLFLYAFKKLISLSGDIIKGRGRVHKMTIFVQNFMDAKHLEEERIDGCSFMVMTAEGPVSMCKHNANRDEFILKPIEITNKDGTVEEFQPLKWHSPKKASS